MGSLLNPLVIGTISVEPPCSRKSRWNLHVDTVYMVEGVCNGFLPYTRFSGSLSSLDITNGNRSHNKPLELI